MNIVKFCLKVIVLIVRHRTYWLMCYTYIYIYIYIYICVCVGGGVCVCVCIYILIDWLIYMSAYLYEFKLLLLSSIIKRCLEQLPDHGDKTLWRGIHILSFNGSGKLHLRWKFKKRKEKQQIKTESYSEVSLLRY